MGHAEEEAERLCAALLDLMDSVERRLVWWENEHKAAVERLQQKQREQGKAPTPDQKREYWMEHGALISVRAILEHVRKQDLRDARKALEQG